MKKIFILSAAIIFSVNVFSQAPNWLWAKRIGGTNADAGYAVAVDVAGNVYTAGQFRLTVDFDPGIGIFNLTATCGYDMFISKLDASGNFIWAKSFSCLPGGGDCSPWALMLDTFGNIYTTGQFARMVDFDPGIGTFALTSAGGIQQDIFISKLDSAGNFVWAKSIGGANQDWGYSITVDANGNVYTTGFFYGTVDFDPGSGVFNLSSPSNIAAFISKLDNSGNFIWAKMINTVTSSGVQGHSIAVDAQQNVYTTGSFGGTADFDPGTSNFYMTSNGGDIFVSKLDMGGNFVWAKQMGGTVDDNGLSIAVDAYANVYTSGTYKDTADFDPNAGTFNLSSAGQEDIFVSKLDSGGNFTWAKSIGDIYRDFSAALVLAANSDIYLTGRFEDTVDFDPGSGIFNLISAGGWDIFVSKLDSAGNFAWAKASGGADYDRGNAIALNNSGNVYVTGYFNSPSINFGSDTLINADSSGSVSEIFIVKIDTTDIITGTNDASTSLSMTSIFPNPATTEVTINFGKEGWCDVRVWNVLGEQVKDLTLTLSKGEGTATIDVSELMPGIYFVVVRDEENGLVVRKVVKM
ncbi:MAG TPA: SBBP repeat-containing protein [Bacteroidia bacterium]|nr:SBBP repeat-containing protein [Bacteroidia bacterium]